MSVPETIDGNAVEEHDTLPVPATPAPASLFHTDDPVEVVEKAARVADALANVIEQRTLFVNIQGKKHVRVEGWQLLGSMLGVTAVCVSTERVANAWKAIVEARTLDGRVIGRADALCSKDERRWRTADEYAVLSMAQTRATAKALKGPLGFVVSLAGYQTTPAEEMTFAQSEPEPATTARQQPTPEPEPEVEQLPAETVAALKEAKAEAGVDNEWLRLFLVGEGVEDVPARVTEKVIRSLTPDQAQHLLAELNAAVDAREAMRDGD